MIQVTGPIAIVLLVLGILFWVYDIGKKAKKVRDAKAPTGTDTARDSARSADRRRETMPPPPPVLPSDPNAP